MRPCSNEDYWCMPDTLNGINASFLCLHICSEGHKVRQTQSVLIYNKRGHYDNLLSKEIQISDISLLQFIYYSSLHPVKHDPVEALLLTQNLYVKDCMLF